MVPVAQAAVSLFGASLSAPSAAPAFPALASSAIGSGGGIAPVAGASLVSTAATVPPAPFADLITEAVGEVQHLEQQAKGAIEGLISGRGVDVHEAMIAAQKAGMGFELVLAVRNKALAAYQQVIGMQF
jgi:flagellar hook-basal body complex protein FliE